MGIFLEYQQMLVLEIFDLQMYCVFPWTMDDIIGVSIRTDSTHSWIRNETDSNFSVPPIHRPSKKKIVTFHHYLLNEIGFFACMGHF